MGILEKMQSIANQMRLIANHPWNRRQKKQAILRFMRWQIGSRLVPGPVAVPFVDETRLLAGHGMPGALVNLYHGLHEFEDMGLVLHALRPNDVFVDVGANVGSYTVLAAGACGASVIAIEPVPSTFAHLMDNIRLNNIESLVTARNIALGAGSGSLRFSEALDTMNHVLTSDETQLATGITVPVETLDSVLAGRVPTLIKIDVEGFETDVLKGSERALQSEGLLAVLMELIGCGTRYGFDEEKLHTSMLDRGFRVYTYEPFTRAVIPVQTVARSVEMDNVLYVRNIGSLVARVQSAPRHTVQGEAF